MSDDYQNFREFYPAYLAEHQKRVTRRLHFVGTLLALLAVGQPCGCARPGGC